MRQQMSGSILARARSHATRDFQYILPNERIAYKPLKQRDSSKLLVAKIPDEQNASLTIDHLQFSDVSELIPKSSLLVLNDSKVIQARIPAVKETGGKAEVFLLRPTGGVPPSIALAETSTSQRNVWTCMLGGKKIHPGSTLLAGGSSDVNMEVINRSGGVCDVKFNGWNEKIYGATFADLINKLGSTPLPPYIRRQALSEDQETYQTVYARNDGSVAAPTAGLHMSRGILDALEAKGVEQTSVTLHVGAGTFAPISGERIGEHTMHEERIEVLASNLKKIVQARRDGRPIVAVGTTSVRTLESLYWHGVKLLHGGKSSNLLVSQWEPYEFLENKSRKLPPAEDALEAVADRFPDSIAGETQLLIVPCYPFRTYVYFADHTLNMSDPALITPFSNVFLLFPRGPPSRTPTPKTNRIDLLITNFHQPESTLLMLVAAFLGSTDRLWYVYNEALENDYRFLSYGDSSLLGPLHHFPVKPSAAS